MDIFVVQDGCVMLIGEDLMTLNVGVIQKGIERNKLLNEEYKWLQMINKEELGKKYYNLMQHKYNHWSTNCIKSKNSIEKMKKSLQNYWSNNEEAKTKSRLLQLGKKRTEETKRKMSESNKLMWIKRKEMGLTRKQVGMLGEKTF